MKKNHSIEIGITLLVFILFSFFLLCDSFSNLENRTLDWRFHMSPEKELKAKIVLVLITDECLSRLGTWPISRSLHASIIDILADAKAKLIAFDIVFEENSTLDMKGDRAFVNSCRKFGNVILPLLFSEVKEMKNTASAAVLVEEVILPFKTLADVAAGFGYVNADFDYLNPDGVIQKTFLTHLFREHWVPSFALSIAEQVAGEQAIINDKGMTFCNQALPIIDLSPWKPIKNSWHGSSGKAIYINFHENNNSKGFLTYSFADIIEKKFNPEDFRDAVVLVGPSAIGLGDIKLTPFGLKPGVVVHANILENILSSNFLTSPSIRAKIGILTIFVLFTLFILFWQGAFFFSTTTFSLFLVAYVVVCHFCFSYQRLVLPMIIPILMVVSQYVVVRFFQLFRNLKQVNTNLKNQNLKLDQRVNELMKLHNAGVKFPAILKMDILSKEILSELCELYKADSGLIAYFDQETGDPSFLGQFTITNCGTDIEEYKSELSEQLKSIFLEKKIVKSPNSTLYSSYLPLIVGDSCWGAICLHEIEGAKKSVKNENFWATFLGICCTALENARLYEMACEVSLACQVQENFLPHEPLELNGYSVFGTSRPATQLGGDYFDYFIVENRYLVVLIADVMGHGVAAALGVMSLKTSVLQRDKDNFAIENLVNAINDTLLSIRGKKFMVTAEFIVIDTIANTSKLYHRGHPFPLKKAQDGKFVEQDCIIAPPLGVRKKSKTPGTNIDIQKGERWVFFTDGLYESLENEKEKDEQVETLMNYFDSRPHLPITEACEDMLKNHPSYLSGKPQPDDYTVLLLERANKNEK